MGETPGYVPKDVIDPQQTAEFGEKGQGNERLMSLQIQTEMMRDIENIIDPDRNAGKPNAITIELADVDTARENMPEGWSALMQKLQEKISQAGK